MVSRDAHLSQLALVALGTLQREREKGSGCGCWPRERSGGGVWPGRPLEDSRERTYLSSPLALLTLLAGLSFTTLRGHRGKSRRNRFQDQGNQSSSKKDPRMGAEPLAPNPHCRSAPVPCSLEQNLTSWLAAWPVSRTQHLRWPHRA